MPRPRPSRRLSADEVVAMLGQVRDIYARLADHNVTTLTDAKLDTRLEIALRAASAGQEMSFSDRRQQGWVDLT